MMRVRASSCKFSARVLKTLLPILRLRLRAQKGRLCQAASFECSVATLASDCREAVLVASWVWQSEVNASSFLDSAQRCVEHIAQRICLSKGPVQNRRREAATT
mmetsp:Transcript_52733/g.125967  ORF Transcript_52733/g.125967 Transcript_52733/m.125967 type:complete len:104 (+) Transcript_52733:1-312(+)